MKLLMLIFSLCWLTTVFADTKVYETVDEQGIPSFSDQGTSSEHSFNVENMPDPTSASTDQNGEPKWQTTDKAIDQKLHAQDEQLAELKLKLDMAQANVDRAQDNLDAANTAMDRGDYRVGNDQYIDEDYIKDLNRNLDQAKQQLSVAQEAYDAARQSQ